MTEPIMPALTAEEWQEHLRGGTGTSVAKLAAAIQVPCHALAALALFGKPYGFKRDDVEMIRSSRAMLRAYIYDDLSKRGLPVPDDIRRGEEAWDSLADRIAALLPEETP
jgi:hypothetical protein